MRRQALPSTQYDKSGLFDKKLLIGATTWHHKHLQDAITTYWIDSKKNHIDDRKEHTILSCY